MSCPSVLLKSPHSRNMFQLALLPPGASSKQDEQQQGQQQQLCGTYRLFSASLDRSLAVSELSLQHGAAAAAAGGGGQPAAQAGSSSKAASRQGAAIRGFPAAGCPEVLVSGARVCWAHQGLGGYVYCVAAQQLFPDMLRQPPGYSSVRVAVGCGDKTVRVLTLGVRRAGADSDAGLQQQAQRARSESGSDGSGGGSGGGSLRRPASEAGSETSGTLLASVLLWKNLSDRVVAVAWHLTNPRALTGHGSDACTALCSRLGAACTPASVRVAAAVTDAATAHTTIAGLLAFGCSDGSLGVYDVLSDQSRLHKKRHAGPVAQLAWQPQQQHAPGSPAVLFSLGGEGCLLAWPAISPNAEPAAAQPADAGLALSQLLQASQAAAGAGSAGAVGGDVIWSCFCWHPHAAGLLAVGSTRGCLLVCQLSRHEDTSSQGSWRAPAAPQQHAADTASWQPAGVASTPAGLPLAALAWQRPAAADAVYGGGWLVAGLDRQHTYLFSCAAGKQQQGSSSTAAPLLVSSCKVASGSVQLHGLAWSDAQTLCACDSDGNCHVLQVQHDKVAVRVHSCTHLHAS